jgi:hypothetical protein
MALTPYEDLPGVKLELPIGGRLFTLPEPSMDDGLALIAVIDGTRAEPITDEEFLQLALGSALDEMRAARVEPRAIVLAAYVAALKISAGRDAAETYWNSAGNVEAALAGVRQAVEQANALTATDAAGIVAEQAGPSTNTAGLSVGDVVGLIGATHAKGGAARRPRPAKAAPRAARKAPAKKAAPAKRTRS